MTDFTKKLSLPTIEALLKMISNTELSLLEHVTAQMEYNLELLKVLENLKIELTNLIRV